MIAGRFFRALKMDFGKLRLRLSLLVFTALALCVAANPANASSPPVAKPLSKSDIIDLLKGDVPAARVGELVQERGVDFEVTAEAERELRRAGATDDLIATIRSVAPKQQGVQIEVTPGDAEVYVDDERQGKTSPEGRLKIATVEPGQHRIRIALDGYRDFERTIEVKRGVMASVVSQLQRSGSVDSSSNQSGPTDNDAGHALLARVIQGLGGKAKVESVKSFSTYGTLSVYLPQGELSGTYLAVGDFSGSIWQSYASAVGVYITVVSPTDAFSITPNGVEDLLPDPKEVLINTLWRNAFFVCQHANDPTFSFSPGRNVRIGNVTTKVLDVRGPDVKVRWFIDPATGWLMRAIWTERQNGMPVEIEEDYQDWRQISGIYVPFGSTRYQNGQKQLEGVLTKLAVNPQIDPALFTRVGNPR